MTMEGTEQGGLTMATEAMRRLAARATDALVGRIAGQRLAHATKSIGTIRPAGSGRAGCGWVASATMRYIKLSDW